MIKDFLVSFKDNFKDRTRNPFLGTYLIVWLIRNWELVYSLFNFDNHLKLVDKINFIKDYYDKNEFLINLWTNVYWSFGLLILTYLLLNISRLITNLSEKRLTPWIYKITDSNSIVLKTEFNKIRSDRDELQIRLDHERELKSKLDNRIEILEHKIIELTSNKLDERKDDVSDVYSVLISTLKKKHLVLDLFELLKDINSGNHILKNKNGLNDFIELGLLKYDKDSTTGGYGYYEFTADGQEVLRRLRTE